MKKIVAYFQDSFQELGKVTWPTKEQTILLTIVTLVVSAVVAGIIAASDLGFNRGIGVILDLDSALPSVSPTYSEEGDLPELNLDNIDIGLSDDVEVKVLDPSNVTETGTE